jgi:hypothetical protein
LGDKADLFQEKGDKSITLTKYIASAMPFYFSVVFLIKMQQRRGIYYFVTFSCRSSRVQFFVLLGHFTTRIWAYGVFVQ